MILFCVLFDGQGTVDIHCYACEDNPQYAFGEVQILNIAQYLNQAGVKFTGAKEKNLTEQQLAINQSFDFSMVLY